MIRLTQMNNLVDANITSLITRVFYHLETLGDHLEVPKWWGTYPSVQTSMRSSLLFKVRINENLKKCLILILFRHIKRKSIFPICSLFIIIIVLFYMWSLLLLVMHENMLLRCGKGHINFSLSRLLE